MNVKILIQEGIAVNMSKQEEIDFTTKDIENLVEQAKEHFKFDPVNKVHFVDTSDTILIDGKLCKRTPDPDRLRRLIPPDKPIVLYCNTRYFLINSAKLQMVNDLKCIVGISQSLGKQLLLNTKTKEADND